MNKMNEELLKYIHNELAPEERAQVEARLRSDSAFAKDYEDAKNFDDELKNMFECAFDELKERIPASDFVGKTAKKNTKQSKAKIYVFANYLSAATMLAASVIFMAAVLIKPSKNAETSMAEAQEAPSGDSYAVFDFDSYAPPAISEEAMQKKRKESFLVDADIESMSKDVERMNAERMAFERMYKEAQEVKENAVVYHPSAAARPNASAQAGLANLPLLGALQNDSAPDANAAAFKAGKEKMILPAEVHAEITRKSRADAKLYIAKVVNSKPVKFRQFVAKKNYDAYFKNLNENTIFEDDTVLSFAPSL